MHRTMSFCDAVAPRTRARATQHKPRRKASAPVRMHTERLKVDQIPHLRWYWTVNGQVSMHVSHTRVSLSWHAMTVANSCKKTFFNSVHGKVPHCQLTQSASCSSQCEQTSAATTEKSAPPLIRATKKLRVVPQESGKNTSAKPHDTDSTNSSTSIGRQPVSPWSTSVRLTTLVICFGWPTFTPVHLHT